MPRVEIPGRAGENSVKGPGSAPSRKVNAMLWRHLCLVRAITAAGLLTFSMLGASAAGEPQEPVPGADSQAETVKVLDAEKGGMLAVEVRGQGQDRVRVSLKNTSGKRLNVVLPPGLVASSSVGQGGGAGGGAGGGFQSMGLGSIGNRSGGFGQFANATTSTGFRSVPPSGDSLTPAVTVPAGQRVDVDIPSVCLNFGLPTPTPRDRFRLVDVDDYSKDPRVRKALRCLAGLGTSHGTAQAAMWRVCNNVPFEVMLERGDKIINPYEVALASRFLDALDQSADSVDPAYLSEARLFVTVEGDGLAAKDAKRLGGALEGLRILGLPARLCSPGEAPSTSSPALHLGVKLLTGQPGETRARVVVQSSVGLGEAKDWSSLGQVTFKEPSAPAALDGTTLAEALDRAVGSAFVTAKVARRSANSTTLRIDNRLPFTVANLTVKAGTSAGSPMLNLTGLGVGPGRTGLATIPAANGSVDKVELNGL
jgi:hypothetical protein